MKKILALLSIAVLTSFFLINCSSETIPYENGTIQVCFTQVNNCTKILLDLINNADTVKTALYDLDKEELINTLKNKNADILIDEDNYFGFGKEVKGSGLMHNKFWILDDYVVTGSLNPTNNGFNKNDNNMLIIKSKHIKENYEKEFEELKNNEKDKPTIYTKIILNNNLIENYFCPEDQCENKVLIALKTARKNIYFITFSFTSDPIGDYLISKKDELSIKGVFEERQAKSQKQYTEYYKMIENDMSIRFDGNKNNMHHKVFIIDNKTVITGSYNPTASGNKRNDENIIIINDKNIAKEFLEEFERVWNLTKP